MQIKKARVMILIYDNLKFRPRALCEQQQNNESIFLILTAIIHSEIIVDLNLCPSKYRCNYIRKKLRSAYKERGAH